MKKLNWLFLIAVTMLSAIGCSRIDTGYVGIESTVGQVKTEELPPGLYFTLLKTVTEVSAKEVALPLYDMKPKSRNNITMQDFDVDLYYKINPQAVAETYVKYSGDVVTTKEGDVLVGSNFVFRQAREAAYSVAAEFDAAEMHTKRTDIAARIMEKAQLELDKDAGKGTFIITNVNVRNIVTDPKLEESIRAAAQVEFQINQKKQEGELAKAEAERKRIEAEGEARANRIIAESLSGAILQLRLAELQYNSAVAVASKAGNTVLMGGGASALVQVK